MVASAQEAQWENPRKQCHTIWKAAQLVIWNAKNAFKQIVHEAKEEALEKTLPTPKTYKGNRWVVKGRDRTRPAANLGEPLIQPKPILKIKTKQRKIVRKPPAQTIDEILGTRPLWKPVASKVSIALERNLAWWLDLQAEQNLPPKQSTGIPEQCAMCSGITSVEKDMVPCTVRKM